MLDFFTSPAFLNASFGLALAGLTLAILAEQLQTVAKYEGIMKQRIAGGYNLAMKVMVANRIGAVLYYLLIAFNIENGISPDTLIWGLSLTVLSISLPTAGMLYWLQQRFNAQQIEQSVLDVSSWPKMIVISTFFATSFNMLGLTVSWIAAATYPDLRLTLANTSFLFNTIFTMINVFYIEDRLAKIADNNKSQIHSFVAGVIAARLVACLMVGLGLMSLL